MHPDQDIPSVDRRYIIQPASGRVLEARDDYPGARRGVLRHLDMDPEELLRKIAALNVDETWRKSPVTVTRIA